MARTEHVKRGRTKTRRQNYQLYGSTAPPIQDLPTEDESMNTFEPVAGGWECCTCFHEDVELCGKQNLDWETECGCGHEVCGRCAQFGRYAVWCDAAISVR